MVAPELVAASWREFDAHWSPDGSKVVLAGDSHVWSEGYAVFVVDLATMRAEQLTPFEPLLRVWGWKLPPVVAS